MKYFHYKNGQLYGDNVSLTKIAKLIGTPFYCYCANAIIDRCNELKEAFSDIDVLIAYALKANSNQAIISLIGKQGFGADIVSLGELERAKRANIDGKKIIFSGVGKSEEELERALNLDIFCFNIESEAELIRLNNIAKKMGKIAPVSVRINPDIDAKTHAKISTGKSENKFGIPYKDALNIYKKIADNKNLNAIGIDMHIGSQILDLKPFENAFTLMEQLIISLRNEGHNISHFDVGGGLGIAHGQDEKEPDIRQYAKIIRRLSKKLDIKIILEPGRWLVGNSGALITKVEYIKNGANKNFIIVNAGMNDLLRPTLYEAHHDIWPILEVKNHNKMTADIVGPICETGDYMAQARLLAKVEQNDLIAIMNAGAYGAVMASNYNSRGLVAEILIYNDRFDIIRERQNIDELIRADKVPNWIK